MIVPALPTSIKSPATNDLRTTSRSASIAVNVHRSPSFGWVTSQGMSQLPSQVECPVVRRAAIRRIAVSQASMGRMAERVGFVPASPTHINNLGQFSIAQIARNTQNLSIRYKTGTAKFLLGRSLRGDVLAAAVAPLRRPTENQTDAMTRANTGRRNEKVTKSLKIVQRFSMKEKLMDHALVEFRSTAARDNRGRQGLERRYSPALQAQAVAYWHMRQEPRFLIASG